MNHNFKSLEQSQFQGNNLGYLTVNMLSFFNKLKRNPAVLKQNHTENSRSPLNDMQFTNSIPMECQVILLVPIVPLVPMDERNPTVLKQNHTLMRCNSPMEYQWNATSLYWYQSYHWYQWTSGIQLYSNRTITKIA